MISVLIVGKGKVGTHLYNAFSKIKEVKAILISSRNLVAIPNADVTIIAVTDDAISKVSSKIKNSFVVHTSGSFAMNDLQTNQRKGVFYMLQTFSENKEIDFSNVPFCLEAEDSKDLQTLKHLAKTIGSKIYTISTQQRKILHVSAVFVNNFTNHMYKIGHDICKKNNVPFEVLFPLIQETSEKILKLTPVEAQTGPAIRNDKITLKNHLNLLDEHQKKIYTILTESIQNSK